MYLTTVGNHESDWPGTSSNPGYGSDSGGECGVCSLQLLPMPAPATTNMPWWSYDIGLIHFVGMSTEHNYTIGSPQHNWIEKDLSAVNRNVTPWVVFSGHRSMYVDSHFCCPHGTEKQCNKVGKQCSAGFDIPVMQDLQANIEILLYKYQVNLAFSGHYHDVQRQAAVYQNTVVQYSHEEYDNDGNTVHVHHNPNATVWMVIGSAGNGPDPASMNYTWSEKYWDYMFGYALLTATNATHLDWKFINSANNEVVDRMLITQNFARWDTSSGVANDDSGNNNSDSNSAAGWGSLSKAAQAGVISVVVIFAVAIIAGVVSWWMQRRSSAQRGGKGSAAVLHQQDQQEQQQRVKSSDATTTSPLQQDGGVELAVRNTLV